MNSPTARRLSIAVTFLMLAGLAVHAEETYRAASVLCAIVPGDGADADFRPVLVESLLVQLTRLRTNPVAAEQRTDRSPSLDELRVMAREGQADYIVVGSYRTTSDDLELRLELYEPNGAAPLLTAASTGRISLTLDVLVTRVFEKIMPAIRTRFPADSVAGAATAAGSVPDIAGGAPLPPARWRWFDVSVGGAPFVTTGSVAEYAKIGALSTVAVDLRFPAGGGAIAAGLLAGTGWLRAAGGAVADVLLVPVGPDLRWTIGADSSPAVTLHASGGPAVVMAITGWAGTYSKIVPYALGGLEVDFVLAAFLGLRLEVGYAAFFEDTMVVQGFVPQLSLRARF